jgi:ribonucleoside-triphosphate reductase (thioredoxin)
MKVMPSMRALWAAGPALKNNNIIGYNCSYLAFKDLFSPVELFYILMCGTGVGFSVEKQFISQMPSVKNWAGEGIGVHVVEDSREGWADSLKVGLKAWFDGKDVEFDYSKVRPRGARLKTMGGRASGPDPLKKLHNFVRDVIIKAQGRQLTSVEWLDVGNMIAEVVVVGGVRRSSEISFSDLNDDGMRHAKDFPIPPHRYMSNNTAVYNGRPDMVTFMQEWVALAASGSGERGIFNTKALASSSNRRDLEDTARSNPCGEIFLKDSEFCNLSEVIVRSNDTFDTLSEKVKSAVWLGAMQACLTDFPFIRADFKENCENERLLGVSLTGQMDNPRLMTADRLADLKDVAIKECRKACKALGINMSAAITTGKPSGTVSQLTNSASGAHPRYAKYYIRRYRISGTDPLFRMMKDQGFKFTPENGQGPESVQLRRKELLAKGRTALETKILVPEWDESQVLTWVVAFPEAAPKNAITRDQVSAIDQLEWYLKVKQNWCEHNQSITVYVRDNEWIKVGAWVYDHFDEIGGISFLPYDGGNYEQAPYEEISKEKYEELIKSTPKVDYSKLAQYELDDFTTGAQALSCSAGGCELQ